MRPSFLILLFLIGTLPATGMAAALTARHSLPGGTIISGGDIALDLRLEGGIDDPDLAIGRQLRTTIQPGQMIHMNNLTAPILVQRNQLVTLVFRSGPLTITDQGRALEPGALGDVIRVLNATSRTTVTGVVTGGGSVTVSPSP